ncbi:MAG: 2'-5' RNA ligase family protein [Candidatus Woesearchaeota archaeon]
MIETYRISCFPDDNASIEIKRQILSFSKHANCVTPTLNEPCVVVKTDFEIDSAQITQIENIIGELAKNISRFNLNVKKIDSYPKREFHYLIESSKELNNIHKTIISSLLKKMRIHPSAVEGSYFNFTIPMLYGDLDPEDYDKMVLELESFYPAISFELDNICIQKKMGKIWKLHKRFDLSL